VRGAYWLGFAAAVVAFADACLYLITISQEDSPSDWGRVGLIATLIVLAGILAVAGSLAQGSARVALFGAATPILLVIGFLGIFSIGLPLLLAGIVTAVGAASA
jgi:low temperature requirement protein LtrA